MRIVAGEFKGRVIKSPDEATTRPTTDRVRESMFSSIGSRMYIEDAHVLDAFGGSGALGIEALSRGAASCQFFEMDDKARKVLSANLSSLGLTRPKAQVRGGDVIKMAERPLHAGHTFDLVTLDPPYALSPDAVLAFINKLADNGDLSDGATIVYEYALSSKDAVSAAFEGSAFEITGQKKYGKTGVIYLEHHGA